MSFIIAGYYPNLLKIKENYKIKMVMGVLIQRIKRVVKYKKLV